MSDRLTGQQLRALAEDSFDVLNWAKRMGMRKEQQIEQLVRTYQIRLGYRRAKVIEHQED